METQFEDLPAAVVPLIAAHLAPHELRSFRASCKLARNAAWPGALRLFPLPDAGMARTLSGMLSPPEEQQQQHRPGRPEQAQAQELMHVLGVRTLQLSAAQMRATRDSPPLVEGLVGCAALTELQLLTDEVFAHDLQLVATRCPALRTLRLFAKLVPSAPSGWRAALSALPAGLAHLALRQLGSHQEYGRRDVALEQLGSERVLGSGALAGLRELHLTTDLTLSTRGLRRLLSGARGSPRLRALTLHACVDAPSADFLAPQTALETVNLRLALQGPPDDSNAHAAVLVEAAGLRGLQQQLQALGVRLSAALPLLNSPRPPASQLQRLLLHDDRVSTQVEPVLPVLPSLRSVSLHGERMVSLGFLATMLKWAAACDANCEVRFHHFNRVLIRPGAPAEDLSTIALMLAQGRLLMEPTGDDGPDGLQPGLPLHVPSGGLAPAQAALQAVLPNARCLSLLGDALCEGMCAAMEAVLRGREDGGVHGWLLHALLNLRVLVIWTTYNAALSKRLLGPGGVLQRYLTLQRARMRAGSLGSRLPLLSMVCVNLTVPRDQHADLTMQVQLPRWGAELLDACPNLHLRILSPATPCVVRGVHALRDVLRDPRRVSLHGASTSRGMLV